MNDLLNFFVRNTRWMLLALYLVLGFVFLINGNPYQQHVYLTSANRVVSAIYNARNSVTSYFSLRDINDDLTRHNARLLLEVNALKEQIQHMQEQYAGDSVGHAQFDASHHYSFILAHVINNSIARPYNYITINRGANDGIRPEMGVIDRNGVVGIVNVTGPHSARIISLLNRNLMLSCKIKGSDNFGSLVWDGSDPSMALLKELPRHTKYHPGDTVVTSGYSAVFPEGIPVGVIVADKKAHNENFFTLKVRLLTDFTTLSNVQIVVNNNKEELSELESHDQNDDNTKF